jgi:hypothetical protein
MLDLRTVTPTVCAALGIPPPAAASSAPVDALRGVRSRRVLLYAPDAIGTWLVREHPAEFDRVRRHAPIEVAVSAMLPSVTPVCFAAMLTGAGPDHHGIMRYEKPPLACETLFDAVAAAGLRAAIATVRESSIDLLFRDKPADRFIEDHDPDVTARTLELLRADEHDLILAYHQEYDDAIHRTEPRSPEALAAMRRHVESFERLAAAAREAWGPAGGLVAFLPDHGTHVDPATGRGTHGSDLPEDLEVTHFYGT